MSADKLVARILDEGASIRIINGKVRLSAAKPLPDALMVQLREVKDNIYQHLIGSHTKPIVYTVPSEWIEGVERVAGMDCPKNWPQKNWPETRQSVVEFFHKWASTAAVLGWNTLDVFGAHKTAPCRRYDSMGLTFSTYDHKLAVMLHDRATLITSTGERLNYYRRKTHNAYTIPMWELETV